MHSGTLVVTDTCQLSVTMELHAANYSLHGALGGQWRYIADGTTFLVFYIHSPYSQILS